MASAMGIDLSFEKKTFWGGRCHTNPTFISSPFLEMKGEGKASRGEGSAKEKVTTRRSTSEVCCAACTVGNGCALKMKNIASVVTEQPHPLLCFENYLLFSTPADVTRTSFSWIKLDSQGSCPKVPGVGKLDTVWITTRVNKSYVICRERCMFVGFVF